MTAALPYGLITIGHTKYSTVSDDSSHADIVFERSNVLHAFWKVYAIRHRVTQDPSDFRCQNLFWRTWRDTSLSETITTSSLTYLWHSCQQRIDVNLLRRPNNHSSVRSGGDYEEAQPKSPPTTFVSRNIVEVLDDCSLSLGQTASSEGSSVPNKSTRRATNAYGSGGSAVTFDDSKDSSRASRPGLQRVNSSSNRTPTAPSTARSKARPSINRRKSSQSTMQGKNTKAAKLTTKSPTLTSRGTAKVDTALSVATTTSAFELPSASSWEDEPAMDMKRSTDPTSCADTSSELVEPNFRNRFAERIASSNSLANMNRMKKSGSVVRFADEVDLDLQKVKGDTTESTPEYGRRPSLTGRGSTASVSSVAVIDEDEWPVAELPRTRSQLSIMIKESRSRQGRQTFESFPSPDHVGLSSRRKRDPTEEEKVLAMAHKEGVTKAGGKQIRKGFKFSDGSESRYSSPSPPTIF